ncbi:MAG: divalent-cation tolerance protein CutA [Verrucomicrobia bacterium]|nr:divalent-cation tolerance protein CutA [Verrucomicrobiota bacterium]
MKKGMHEMLLVLCTFPDSEQARQIGTTLVERQLAACVNLLPGVESVFRWNGQVEHAAEVLVVFKTASDTYPALAEALAAAHPYEVPEIVALRPAAVAEAYLAWVLASSATMGNR